MKNRVGEIRKSNCGLMKIIEYNGALDITVKFKTGSIVKTNYDHFKKGEVKDPLFPSVFGIGYVGVGKYKPSINRKLTIEYITWQNMLKRCYDPLTINRQPTYRNVTVCEEWKNFQTFAEWHQENYYKISGEIIELDKDIIKRDNKIYCPEFCSFVPQSINKLLIKSDKSRGKYPIGVCFHKPLNKYQSQLAINGKIKHLGYFSTSTEAFQSYKIAKEKQVKIIANKYKNVLDQRLYNSLMQYEILITD